jgi:hypothetical protein
MSNKILKYQNKLRNVLYSQNPNIAICFYGLCRSTNYTIESINKCIFEALKNLHFNYDVYLHTYKLTTSYTNLRNNEENIMLDNDLYKLLNPNVYKIDDQDDIKKTDSLMFNKYRSKGDPWSNDFKSLDNLILGLYSLYQVTQLWKNSNSNHDQYYRIGI